MQFSRKSENLDRHIKRLELRVEADGSSASFEIPTTLHTAPEQSANQEGHVCGAPMKRKRLGKAP